MANLSPFEDAGVDHIAGTPYRVNSVMADRVNRLIAAAPEDLQPELLHSITSGYRDWETQAKLYLRYLSGGGLAAKPGASWHERYHGMAVDWNRATPRAFAYLKSNGPQFGIVFPLGPKDPYHSQAIETVHGNSRVARGGDRLASLVAGAGTAPSVPISPGALPETPAIVAPVTQGQAPIEVPPYQSGPIITPPTKPIEPPPAHALPAIRHRVASHIPTGHLSRMSTPSFSGVMRTALAHILRQR